MEQGTSPLPRRRWGAWLESLVVVLVALVAAALAVAFNLHEALYGLTRRWEWLQVDELPLVLIAVASALAWLAWRRNRQAREELDARRDAEARLQAVLSENRALAQQQLTVLEEERRVLARELHDELGQYLNALKLDALSLVELEPAQSPVGDTARRMVHSVDHLYAVVRDMIGRLRPAGLDELGLPAALQAAVDQWRRRPGSLQLHLHLAGELEDLGEVLNLTVYRMVQEALTNVYRHARATRVDISLRRDAFGPLHVSIEDDGQGSASQVRTPGFGLQAMRERVTLAGGDFAVRAREHGGWMLEARLPVPATQARGS